MKSLGPWPHCDCGHLDQLCPVHDAAPDLLEALEATLSAMEKSVAIGCTDHLDACDDAGKFWHDANDKARAAVAKAKGDGKKGEPE